MNKNDIIKYAAIAGGAYLVYWYITSHGPTGAVSEGHASYWDTWFGTQAQPPQPGSNTGVQPGYPNQPAQAPQPGPAQPVLTQPSQPAPPTINQGVKAQIIAASNAAGANQPGSQIQGGYAIPDIWSYFWQQVTGRTISTQQMTQAFQGSVAPLTVDQFLAAISGVGLSGIGVIVQAPSAPSIPSMSFGGSFRKPGMRGMGGRTSINGGQTIQ